MASILSFLGFTSAPAATDSETIQPIAEALERLEPSRARFIAAFAFVLSRLAAADHEVSADEAQAMERLVQEIGDLTSDEAALVVNMATHRQQLFGAIDDFLVTRELQRGASYEERLHVVECLFAIATIDGSVRHEEGEEISRIARELRIETADLSRLRGRLVSRPPQR